MKIKQTARLLIAVVALFGLFVAVPVYAQGECGGAKTSLIECDAQNSEDIADNGIWQVLLMVINILTAGIGLAGVGGIIYGAILYTTAEDKAAQVQQAVDIIRNVLIGLVAFGLMWAGLNFIIPGGVFS